MLLNGVNHVALLINDTNRLHALYREVFDATVSHDTEVAPGMRLSLLTTMHDQASSTRRAHMLPDSRVEDAWPV
jgi:hypothetical protein